MIESSDNRATERSLIGALLLDAEKVSARMDAAHLDVEAFTDPECIQLFKAVSEMLKTKAPVDAITVVQWVNERTTSKKTYIELEALIEECPTVAHAEYFIGVLSEKFQRRQMAAIFAEAQQASLNGNEDSAMVRASAEAKISELTTAIPVRKNAATLLSEYAELYDKAESTQCAGISSGFPWWDDNFGGLQDRVYYIVSGPPGCFKTTLVRNIAEHVAGRLSKRVDFCSLEQSAGQILSSIAARLSGCSVSKLQAGRSGKSLAAWKTAAKHVSTWPIFVSDEPQTDESLWAWARGAKSKGSSLLILDYLQFVKPTDTRCSDEQRVARASETVRQIAMELKIPFIAISSESNEGKLRHSGQVEYDAWCWVRMRKDVDERDRVRGAFVAIKKNRFGPQVAEWSIAHSGGAMSTTPPPNAGDKDDE